MGGAPTNKVLTKKTSRAIQGGKFGRAIKQPPKVPKQQMLTTSDLKKVTERPSRMRATLGEQQDVNTRTTLGG
tara:strand:+ start:273 stop:491 length:219 start_codon:yes stop_codon:yes gene_type:complete